MIIATEVTMLGRCLLSDDLSIVPKETAEFPLQVFQLPCYQLYTWP